MTQTIIIGDGPGGLSAALFLAKKDHKVTVFGQDGTPMHKAMLYNYLGIPEMTGSQFQQIARQQVQQKGAEIVDQQVTQLQSTAEGFLVTTATGQTYRASYLVLACGRNPELAQQLGLQPDERGSIDADRDGKTSVENLFVVGWTTRPMKIQAIISAGDGAATALTILSKEAGKEVHDFDVVASPGG